LPNPASPTPPVRSAIRLSPWPLFSFAVAALAVLAASLGGVRWLTLASAGLGIATACAGLWVCRLRGRLSLLLGGGLCTAILLLAVLAPGVLNPFWAMDSRPAQADPNRLEMVSLDRAREDGRPLAEGDWADADTEGFRQDDLFIHLESVKAGRLLERGGASFLLVHFHLVQFQPGRTVEFERFAPGKNEPVLTDDTGRPYSFVVDRVKKPPTKFDVLLKVDHLLVFELPPSQVRELKLEVPAAAWGRQGVCRFRITKIGQQESTPDMAKLIAQTRAMLRKPAAEPPDPALGRTLFAKNCQECHTLHGFGGKVGPDLTKSKREDLDFVLTSILDPSAVIEKQYLPTIIVTSAGVVYNGIIKQQDADSVSLMIPNRLLTIPRRHIEEMRDSKVSLMPNDLLKGWGEHEVRSLIAYLSGKNQTAMLATPENAPYFFFYAQDLSNWESHGDWRAEGGEVAVAGAEDGRPALAVSRLHLPGDFHLTFRFDPGEGGRAAVLLCEAGRPDQPAGLRVELAAGAAPLLAGVDGVRFLGNGADNTAQAGSWNKLEIIVGDDRILVRLGGEDVAEAPDLAPLSRRVIVLEGPRAAGHVVHFRNLDVRLTTREK
jgi:putative heme-binding domain-containing protein